MKFLDEYRDPKLARAIVAEIRKTVTRPAVLMEICGGQTHTLMRYGIDELLPEQVELVHGPGCPVCVTPLEIIDKAVAIASTPDVTLVSYGDMLRVPGSESDLLRVKAAGGDVRIVYSPMDALGIARQHPERRVVFFAVGFETTAPANAMAVWQAKREGLRNFSILVSHVLVPPAIRLLLGLPANRVQGFIAPGHVCTVMGYTEYEELAAQFHVPFVVGGFEPLDLLEAILMLVRQLEEGRAEVENQYVRSVTRRRQRTGAPPHVRGFRGGRPEMARHRRDPALRLPPAPRVRRVRCRAGLRHPDPRGGGARRVHRLARAARAGEARGLLRLRHPLHARDAPGRAHGLERRRLRRLLSVPAAHRPGDAVTLSCPLPLPAKDRILLGHGSGGKLSADLLRDVFLPVFRSPVLSRLDDQAVVEIGGARLAFTTDSFVVKPLFFRGGDIGSLAVHGTVNDLAMCGAEPLYLSAAFILEEGFEMAALRRISESMARAAEAAGVEIVTGDTKVVEKGSGDGVFINTTGIGLVPPGLSLSAANARPGDRVLLSGTLGDHGIAILSEREGIAFDTPAESDSAPLNGLVREMLAAANGIRAMRDPTRGGLASTLQRDRRAVRGGHGPRGGGHPDPRSGPRRLRTAGTRSACTWRTKASWSPSLRPIPPPPSLPPCDGIRWARSPRSSARSLAHTGDGHSADDLRDDAPGEHAGRRPVAPDLLSHAHRNGQFPKPRQAAFGQIDEALLPAARVCCPFFESAAPLASTKSARAHRRA